MAATDRFDVDGKTFMSKPVFETKPEPPKVPTHVDVFTLQGFADLISESIETLKPEEYVVHVRSFANVVLIAKKSDEHGRRQKLIDAGPVKFDQFEFGKWITQEEFVIAVSSRFVNGGETNDKDYVLRIASSLTSDATSISEDNGFSQKATIKAGLAHLEITTLKPQVNLAPFRTFPEVGQPISSFVFRAKQSQNGPLLMLVEADGGKWKIDAINEVRRFLATLNIPIPIVA